MHMIKFLINMENFIIQICMRWNLIKNFYVRWFALMRASQTGPKEWDGIGTFFHSNEMMSRLPFIRMNWYRDHLSSQSNEMIVLPFNSHLNWEHAKSSHPDPIRFILRRNWGPEKFFNDRDDVETFFHSNEMMSGSSIISIEWNDSIFIQLSSQLRRKFLALLSTQPNPFRGVTASMIQKKNFRIVRHFRFQLILFRC